MACLVELPKESPFSLKEHGSTTLVCKFATEQTSRHLNGWTRPKWSILATMHSTTFGKTLETA